MKSVYKIFAVILAAGLTIMSCDKKPINEDIPVVNPEGGDETDPADGPRVITVSFNTKATRTVFDEDEDTLIPSFARGDVIVVTDGHGTKEECEVYFVGEYARIDITKETLKDKDVIAVYPKSAYIDNEPYFKVPSVQDGTFANANICKATIKANKTSAVFKNQTAVFVVDLPSPEKTINLVVESLYKISSSTGQRDEDASYSYIACDGIGEDDYSDIITVSDEENGLESPCFVSVYVGDGILLRDLNFDAIFTYDATDEIPATGSSGGFSPRFLKGYNLSPDTRVQAGLIYSGVGSCLHRYFTTPHDATKNLPTLRWAIDDLKVNGGTFFMWGELNGHSYVPAEGDNPAYWTGFANEGGFSSTNKNTLSKTYVRNEILILEDDSVYQNWGGAWRMPTKDEFLVLDDYGGEDSFAEYMSCWSYVSGASAPSHLSNHFYWTSQMAGNNMNILVFRYTISVDNIIEGGSFSVGNSYYYGICIKPAAPID